MQAGHRRPESLVVQQVHPIRLGTIRPAAPYSLAPPRPFSLGQTFDQMFGWSPAMGDAVRLAFHGATAYLGFHVWTSEDGFLSAFGLILALGQSVGAICDVVSLVQRASGTKTSETSFFSSPWGA